MIKVKLLDYTPEPERVVAMAARLCYSASGAEELAERLSEEKVREMVRKMVKIGHGSTLEHASFTFGIEGVSRVLTHQLVRHRIASYSQQSQRYVDGSDFDYLIPPEIRKNPEALARFEGIMQEIGSAYRDLKGLLEEAGRTGSKANEDARFVLPNACETKMV
ncbi:FAD-dependent thymidylate synthase, partial [Mitsuokella jalaludinii]|uniref:FAD-dependent thymidylate synthase n=1 Tax=Mitsuokella jalaludinii TaxID=187979 RepID=UPI003077A220